MTSAKDLYRRELIVVTGKGGVGKSTLAVNFATMAKSWGLKVLLVDLDPVTSQVLSWPKP